MGQHQGGLARLGNHVGNGEGFARARGAQQGLIGTLMPDAVDQLRNGPGLITHGLIRSSEGKPAHGQLAADG